jgi:hypothetical protein
VAGIPISAGKCPAPHRTRRNLARRVSDPDGDQRLRARQSAQGASLPLRELSRRENLTTAPTTQADLSRHALKLKLSHPAPPHPGSGRSASEGIKPKERREPLRIRLCRSVRGAFGASPSCLELAQVETPLPLPASQNFLVRALLDFFSRTPAPLPPSSGMNSTPAASKASWIFPIVSAAPRIAEELSIRFSVATLMEAHSDNFVWLMSKRARAARICAGPIMAADHPDCY